MVIYHMLKWLKNLVPFLALGGYLFGVAGFFFHTSEQAEVFNKYNPTYFVVIVCFLLLSPYVYFLFRFLCSEHVLRLPNQKSVVFSPAANVLLFLITTTFLLGFVNSALYVARHMMTSSEQKMDRLDAFHPYLQTRPAGAVLEKGFNSWGFRGEEIEKEKPANTYRIFFLGGSTVLADNTPYQRSHAALLEKWLQEARPQLKIEVQNAAYPWHTSQHSLIKFLTYVVEFEPDLIIVWHGINDLYNSLSPDQLSFGSYRSDYGHFFGPLANMVFAYTSDRRGQPFLEAARFFEFWFSDLKSIKLKVRGRKTHAQKIKFVDVPAWESLGAFERNLDNLVFNAKAKGVKVLLASQPFVYRHDLTKAEMLRLWMPRDIMIFGGKAPNLKSLAYGMNQFNKVAEKVASKNEVTFLNLEKLIPKNFNYFTDDVHYTERANKKIAKSITLTILKHKLIR